MPQIVEGLIKRKKFVYLCTNALLLKKNLKKYTPSDYLTFSVHLDGLEEEHDHAVSQQGVFKRAVEAIKLARQKGFRVNVNTTLFNNANPESVAKFIDFATDELNVEGVTISPGYAYERAPDQQHFLNRKQTKELFRGLFRLGKGKKWEFSQSSLFLDFLAGNQKYHCTPWSNPTRNVFGWQRPCYLINEGYTNSFQELMETTEWDQYGVGNYEKCADCMVHCGFEGTAVVDTVNHPLKALKVALKGVDTEKPMVEDVDLTHARPAEYIFDKQVSEFMTDSQKREAQKILDAEKEDNKVA